MFAYLYNCMQPWMWELQLSRKIHSISFIYLFRPYSVGYRSYWNLRIRATFAGHVTFHIPHFGRRSCCCLGGL